MIQNRTYRGPQPGELTRKVLDFIRKGNVPVNAREVGASIQEFYSQERSVSYLNHILLDLFGRGYLDRSFEKNPQDNRVVAYYRATDRDPDQTRVVQVGDDAFDDPEHQAWLDEVNRRKQQRETMKRLGVNL